DRMLAQELGAERVDRADARGLELAKRVAKPQGLLVGAPGRLARALELAAEPQLELARRGFRERDRDHVLETCVSAADRRHHAMDELGRLPGSRRRLDDERGGEVAADAIARGLIGEGRAHGSSRRRASAAKRSGGFRSTRASSYGPHTAR